MDAALYEPINVYKRSRLTSASPDLRVFDDRWSKAAAAVAPYFSRTRVFEAIGTGRRSPASLRPRRYRLVAEGP